MLGVSRWRLARASLARCGLYARVRLLEVHQMTREVRPVFSFSYTLAVLVYSAVVAEPLQAALLGLSAGFVCCVSMLCVSKVDHLS